MTYRQFLHMRLRQLLAWVRSHPKRAAIIGGIGVLSITSLLVLAIFTAQQETAVSNDATSLNVQSQVATTVGQLTTIDPQTGDTTMKWIKSPNISDDTLSVSGDIIETIDENQVFSGELSIPQGWTALYSTDSRDTPEASRTYSTYNTASPPSNLSSITFLKIKTTVADNFKPYAAAPLVRTMDAKQIITDDRLPGTPILFQNKVYTITRGFKAATADNALDCFDLLENTRCVVNGNSGFFPVKLSSTSASSSSPTALGTGTEDINTPLNYQYVMDDGTYGHNGRVYIPGQVGNNYGVVCVDLGTLQNCGFTSLGSATAPTGTNPSWLVGFVQSGSKIYGHANDADTTYQTVVCFDIRDTGSGGGVCSGYTSTTVATTLVQNKTEHGGDYDTPGGMVLDGNRMYWTVNYRYDNLYLAQPFPPTYNFDGFGSSQRDYGTVFTCFDVSTRVKCTDDDPTYNYQQNWPRFFYDSNSGLATNREYMGNIFAWKDTDGTTTKAICYVANNVSLGQQSDVESRTLCYSKTGANFYNGSPSTPATTPAQPVWQGCYLTIASCNAWRAGPNATTITDATNGHKKTYYPYQFGTSSLRGAMICFDWTTQAACSGIPAKKYWYTTTDGTSTTLSGDEGYVYDGSCMYGLSRKGFLWSFNPSTAETPCRVSRTTYTASINTNNFYCDGQTHAFAWKSATVANASLYDFQNYNVNIYDTSGGSLLGQSDVKQNGPLDISSNTYTSHNSLYLSVDSNTWSTSPWANANLPYAMVRTSANTNVQYCFKTRAKTYVENIACDVTKLGTLSQASFASEDNTYTSSENATINFTQQSDKQCFKDIKVRVTTDKTRVVNGDQVTYTIHVDNKANPDTNHRGDIGGLFNPKSAQIEATIPSGMEFISASDGGTLSNNGTKVVWTSQAVAALQTIDRTVVLKAPGPVASKPKPQALLAASTEYPLTMDAAAIYDDDVYQSDNTTSNNMVTYENNASPTVSDLAQTVPSPRAPATLHFTVTATDDAAVEHVYLLDGNDSVLGEMTPSGVTDQYEYTLNNYDGGDYQFKASAVDGGDPILTTTSSPINVTVRAANIAPQISNFTQTTTNLHDPAGLVFTATVTDETGIDTVVLQENGTTVGTMTPTGTPNQYGVTLNNYHEGSYSFTVRATDNDSPAATTTSSALDITVLPNTAPGVSGLTQTNSNPRDPATLHFTVTATDDHQIASVKLLKDSTVVGTMTPTGTPNQYEYSLSGYSAGTHNFSVRATDNGSPALSTTSSAIAVVVQPNLAPAIDNLVQTNSSLQAPATLHFTVSASDEGSVTSVKLYSGQTLIGIMTPTGISNQYEVSVSGYGAGNYSFHAVVADNGSPALTSDSNVVSLTVSEPPVVTPPTTPTTPTTPANTAPQVSDLKVSAKSAEAPATLGFSVSVEDDSGIAKVELLQGGELVQVMPATTTAHEYALTLSGYAVGDYEFSVRATDNGNPALSTTTQVVAVIVRAASVTTRTQSSAPNSGQTRTYTPVAIREAIPNALTGSVESVFKTADAVVKPIPKPAAKVLPYTAIGVLGGFALFYAYIAFRQTRTRIQIRNLLTRFKTTEVNRKNYLNLTSHYLNTPLATMQSAVELYEGQKSLSPDKVSRTKKRLEKLATDIKALLDDSSESTYSSEQFGAVLGQVDNKQLLKNFGVIGPVLGVLIVGILMNFLFVWSQKYSANAVNFIVQTMLYVLGVIGFMAAYSFRQREQLAMAAINQELSLEQSIADSQSSFIRESGSRLSSDIVGLRTIAADVENIPQGSAYTNGLMSLDKVVDKFTYLDTLTSGATVSQRPIALDVSTQVVLKTYTSMAEAKNIALTVNVQPNIEAYIDEDGFRHILGSLLDNAVKFTPDGGNITVSLSEKAGKVILKVKDSGPGIPKDKIDGLFQPFSRGTGTEQYNYEGMGVDLYMNKLITDRWGGTISISSEVGKGTTVTTTLSARPD